VVMFFAAMPSTSNYQLNDYGFGNGGGTTSSTNYHLEGITGEQTGDASTATYTDRNGLQDTQQANEPSAPTVTNPSNWYNKLHVVINNGGNPSDATFVIAISTDNFTTTNYIQNDNTVGASLVLSDYQTYSAWGSASGFDVVGLAPNTTYYFKVKANRGQYTESGYSPTASVATSQVSMTFDIDVSASNSSTSPPYNVAFGNLNLGSVTDSPTKVWFSLDTNALYGGTIYIVGSNTGLRSSAVGYTITSASADLSSAGEGFGAQSSSVTQSAGGPIASVSPYNVASNNVGIIDTTYRSMYATSAAITGGRTSFLLKTKTQNTTPAANDYTDTLTAVAAAAF